jgi:regulation of enolase protein 1 (concanavalin A-like superfamily)
MEKYALLVGVSNYDTLPALPGATRDIKEISKILQDSSLGGFLSENITLLEDPDRTKIEDEIYELFDDRKKDDLVLFYFAGHGLLNHLGEFYLAARHTCRKRGKLKDITAISAKYLQEKMGQSLSEQQVIILDCCFSGAFSKGMSVRSTGKINFEVLGGKGRAVLASSTSTQYSFEHQSSGLGVYTHYFVEGIKTGTADGNKDGWISVNEIHEYVSSRVKEHCVEKGIDPPMRPEIYASREGYKIIVAKTGNIKLSLIPFSSPIDPSNLKSDFVWSKGNSSSSKYLLLEDGALRISTVGHTDQSNGKDSAPSISYSVKGSFEAEIQVKFSSTICYQRAGFGIRSPANRSDYFRIQMLEYERVEVSVSKSNRDRVLANLVYGNDIVVFKIQRLKDRIQLFHSFDGSEWLHLSGEQQVEIPDEAELFFNVLSAHNLDEAVAEFRMFKVAFF